MSSPTPLKQIVLIRRKAGQSISQFFKYHYQEHGRLSVGPTPQETPLAYYQTHFFDSSYSSSTPAMPSWAGHNDQAELYFSDGPHIGQVFGSAHVREVVGPDGKNFNDFAAAIPMFVVEEVIAGEGPAPIHQGTEQSIVATYWVQAKDSGIGHVELAKKLNPKIAEAFGKLSSKVVANVALPDEAGTLKYFRGQDAPDFSAAYQVFLRDIDEVSSFDAARIELEKELGNVVDISTSFVVYGVRGIVFDREHVPFDKSRQPKLP